jgi:acyl-CoA hydrolase
MTQIVMPGHTNGGAGVLFGGTMVQWIDVCAGVAAMRHAGGAVVTASIDRLDFICPVKLGQVVVLQAQVNFTAHTSMEAGCRVETEDPVSGARNPVTKAYLTFVAVDERGRPRPVAPLQLESDDRTGGTSRSPAPTGSASSTACAPATSARSAPAPGCAPAS